MSPPLLKSLETSCTFVLLPTLFSSLSQPIHSSVSLTVLPFSSSPSTNPLSLYSTAIPNLEPFSLLLPILFLYSSKAPLHYLLFNNPLMMLNCQSPSLQERLHAFQYKKRPLIPFFSLKASTVFFILHAVSLQDSITNPSFHSIYTLP